jgi:DNA-directed RNA polymerase beta' subunit
MVKRFSEILAWVKKNVKHCVHCDQEKMELSISNEMIVDSKHVVINSYKILRVLENLDDETIRMLGFDPEMSHPKNFVFTMFPILPPCCRPYVMSDENCCDDDLTYQLSEIIKNNQYLSESYLSKTESKRKKSILQSSIMPTSEVQQKHMTNLRFRISTYFNNSKKKAKHAATARPITGLKERIAGKEGQIRHNLLGKRCDQSGRTVIGPDPTLRLDELAIPKEMAQILTIPEYVTPFNKSRLSALVNSGKANFVIKAGDPTRSINLKNAVNYRGTLLYFGDVIHRKGHDKPIVVQDTKFNLIERDIIYRNGKPIKEVTYPRKQTIDLECGDLVKRQLCDGDYVLLNRQPTLHKPSMMSFKVIIREGKTIRMNLATTKPYNADFDGDEMNLHVPQSYEAIAELKELSCTNKCIMSVQNGKPNMAIVQDSLIGAFLLSKQLWETRTMSKERFFDLLSAMRDIDVLSRMEVLRKMRPPPLSIFNGRGILSFLFPSDFYYTSSKLYHDQRVHIEAGVWIEGILAKDTSSLLIKILYKDYNETVVSTFINNIQFVTNEFLIEEGFTINASDCLPARGISAEIRAITQHAFAKATTTISNTRSAKIREHRTLGILNAAADRCMKLSKDTLSADNHFKITEESGSKGSVFNICQITSLLGQQTIDSRRVMPLLHFQPNTFGGGRDFKAGGYIESSFVEGLKPREFLHHAMAGRKGVIDTALLTSVSGYGQRQGVKLSEDIKVFSDNTVRDANGRVYQYIFGDAGYDPSQTIVVDGVHTVMNLYRLSHRLNSRTTHLSNTQVEKPRYLSEEEIESVLDFIKLRPKIPRDIEERIYRLRKDPLAKQLRNIQLREEFLPELKEELEKKYYSTLMTPGECVGIIGAQSMGEFSTQATLNTFHSAGSTTTGVVTNCLTRFQEINNATKNPKQVICKVYFTHSNSTIEELREMVGSKIKQFKFANLVSAYKPLTKVKESWYKLFAKVFECREIIEFKSGLRCILRTDHIYAHRIHPSLIKAILEKEHDVTVVYAPLNVGLVVDVFQNDSRGDETETCEDWEGLYQKLSGTNIVGLDGVKNIHFCKDDKLGVWYIQTEGGLLKDFYSLDDVDKVRTTTSNIWDIYNTLGIEAAREFRVAEMVEIMGSGVDISHIKLRADRLTFTGTIQSLTRYTMRGRGEKPLSKVGFEEIMENFYKTARDAEIDDLAGVSASIMCGKRAKIGTSMFDLKFDFEKVTLLNSFSERNTHPPGVSVGNPEDEEYRDYDYTE